MTDSLPAQQDDSLCDCCSPSDGAICRCEKSANPFWLGFAAGQRAPKTFPGQQDDREALREQIARKLYDVDLVAEGKPPISDKNWNAAKKIARRYFAYTDAILSHPQTRGCAVTADDINRVPPMAQAEFEAHTRRST